MIVCANDLGGTVMDGTALFWIIFLAVPATAGAIVAVSKPPEFVSWINRFSTAWNQHYECLETDKSVLVGIWAALIWGTHKLHHWTATVEDDANRAGMRLALFSFVAALSVIIIASLIYLAIGIAIIAACLWVASMIFGDGSRPSEQDSGDDERRRMQPRRRTGRSRERTDWFGNEYTEHLDDERNVVAKSVVKKDWWGNEYIETRNAEGEVIETSRQREGWFGREYVEHRNADGEKSGESQDRTGWFGDEYVEHRDAEGVEQSRSRERTDWWGDPYTEHKPKD